MFKKILRARFRKSVQELQLPLEIPYHSLVVSILNSIFGNSPEAAAFWDGDVIHLLCADFNFDILSSAAKITSIGKGVVDWYRSLVESEEGDKDAAKKSDKKKRSSFYKKGTTSDISYSRKKPAPIVLASSASARDNIARNHSSGIGSSSSSPIPKKPSVSDVSADVGGVAEAVRSCTILSVEPGVAQFSTKYILTRMFSVMGITLSPSGKKKIEICDWGTVAEPFEMLDIDHVGGRVKHMNIVALAKGQLFFLRAHHTSDESERREMYESAIKEYSTVLSSSPTNQDALLFMARAMIGLLKLEDSVTSSEGSVAMKSDHSTPGAVAHFTMSDPQVSKVNNYFGRLTRFHPNCAVGHLDYAK